MNPFKAIGIALLALLGVAARQGATRPGDIDSAGLRGTVTGDTGVDSTGVTGPIEIPLDTIPADAVADVAASDITTPLKIDGVLPLSSVDEFRSEHGRELAVQEGTWFCLYNGYSKYTRDTIVAKNSVQFKITNIVGKEIDTVNPCLKIVFETTDNNIIQVAIGKSLAKDLVGVSGSLVCDLQKFFVVEAVYNAQRTSVTVSVLNGNDKIASTVVSVSSGAFNGNLSPYSPEFSVPGIFDILRDSVVATDAPITIGTATAAPTLSQEKNGTSVGSDEVITKNTGNIPKHDEPEQTSNAGAAVGGAIGGTLAVAASVYAAKRLKDKYQEKSKSETKSTTQTSASGQASSTSNTTANNPKPIVHSPGGERFAKAETKPAVSVKDRVNELQGRSAV